VGEVDFMIELGTRSEAIVSAVMTKSVEAAERRREERAEFLRQELMHRLRTAVTRNV